MRCARFSWRLARWVGATRTVHAQRPHRRYQRQRRHRPRWDECSITVVANHATELIVDIKGYFAPPGAGRPQF